MAVPPLAETLSEVELPTLPPSTLDRAAPGVANADGVSGVAAAVHVADSDRAAIGGSGGDAAVTGGSGVGVSAWRFALPVCPPRPLNPTLGQQCQPVRD